MDRIAWLTLVLILALAGLLGLQGYWVNQNYEIRNQEYRGAVQRASYRVADHLERLHLGKAFRKRQNAHQHRRVKDTVVYGDNGARMQVRIEEQTNFGGGNFGSIQPDDDADNLLQEFYEEFRLRTWGNPWEMINSDVVDSLFLACFEAEGINPRFTFTISDRRGQVQIESAGNSDKVQVGERLSLPLWRSKFFGDYKAQLEVFFPRLNAEVYFSMWPQFLMSFGLVAILCIVFYTAISTIYRQKRLSEVKTDFINNMTHELKTPISTIRLAAEALGDKSMVLPKELSDKYIGMISSEGVRLTNLVDEVLTTAQMERDSFRIEPHDFNWREIQSTLEEKFTLIANKSGGELVFSGNWDVHFSGDQFHLTNALSNLLDNAFKYGGMPPRVNVRLKQMGGELIVSVSDNGKGIKKEEQDRIFENLYRVSKGDRHDVKGFGIGLFYTQKVMEQHSGKIVLESKLGRGSEFKLIFNLT